MSAGASQSPAERIAQAGVVGAGGAGFPTHAKLAARAEVLICNAAECEPLLHANQELLRLQPEQVIAGLLLAAGLVGASRIVIALKAKYHAAIAALRAARETAGATGVELHLLPDYYPAGDEHAIVQEVTGRIVPEAGLPLDVGVVVQNAETLANVAQALQGRPVVEKWVTVTGAVRAPVTLRAAIGAPMTALIAAAGGATVRDFTVMEGGPMMGRVIPDPAAPISKTTGGVIVLPREHPRPARAVLSMEAEIRRTMTSCIRCTLCTQLCPRYLQGHDLRPHQIMQSLALLSTDDPLYDQAALCSECGICEVFSCPVGLSPRKVLGHLKREFARAGRRFQKRTRELHMRDDAALRRLQGKRLLLRMGLDVYDRPAPYQEIDLHLTEVRLPLRQHVGATAEPVVRVGDRVGIGELVAQVPEGKLGAPVHASLAGKVAEVTGQCIRIVKEG